MRSIKLMPDYCCFPLWEAVPGGSDNIDPGSLPISSALKRELEVWATAYDETLNMEDPAASGFATELEKHEFQRRGRELADRLRAELGSDFEINVFLYDGAP